MSENSEIHLKGFECKHCNKKYSSHSSLCNHNKKFHNNDVSKNIPPMETNIPNVSKNIPPMETNNITYSNLNVPEQSNKLSKLNCSICNKEFSTPQNRWKHENRVCKNKVNLLEENNKLKENFIKLEGEIEKLKNNQIIPLNNSVNTNNTNTTNNNHGIINKNNGTINNTLNKNNNYMYINQIGNERINLTPKQIKSIVSEGLNGAMTCVRNINFNKKKPENHNFYSNSLEGQFCTAINEKTQKPETIPKKEIVDRVLESSFKILEGISIQIECNNDFRERFTDEEIEQLHNIINNKKKFYEKKNKKIFHNSVIGMSYTYKHLILSTWKLLQPDFEESDTDSIPDITEVHYYPGDTSDEDDEEFIPKISKKLVIKDS